LHLPAPLKREQLNGYGPKKKKQKNEMYVLAQLFSFALVPLSFCLSRAPKGAQISFDFFAHSMEKKTHTFDSFHL